MSGMGIGPKPVDSWGNPPSSDGAVTRSFLAFLCVRRHEAEHCSWKVFHFGRLLNCVSLYKSWILRAVLDGDLLHRVSALAIRVWEISIKLAVVPEVPEWLICSSHTR